MLRRAKQWYEDTPRYQRYSWGNVIAFVIWLVAFFHQLATGVDFFKAFNSSVILYFVIPYAIVLVPQFSFDWIRGYGKHRSELDEMEMTIFWRAMAVGFSAVTFYFMIALFAAGKIYGDGSDMISIPESALRTVLLGAVFVLIWAQGIALVILYSHQEAAGGLQENSEQAQQEK